MGSILVLTYWSFNDALIQAYTLPYVKIITRVSNHKVYLVCLEQEQQGTSKQQRTEINKELAKNNIEVAFFKYNRFGIKQAIMWAVYLSKLSYIILKNKVRFIHTWGAPAGAIGYILSVLLGKSLILDSYEPHAEAMVENGTWRRTSWAYRILLELEKRQSRRAKYYIAAASGMKAYAQKTYGITINNDLFFTKPACTNIQEFSFYGKDHELMDELALHDKIVCVYAGKFGGIYLYDEVFDLFKQCYLHWGEQFKVLLLTNASAESVLTQIQRVCIPPDLVIQRFVGHTEIPRYLSVADFAINPVKPVPSKRYCTPIKDGEYWAMGLPVIITDGISDDSEIIRNNDAGYVLKELTDAEYKRAIIKVDSLLKGDINVVRRRITALAYKYRDISIAEHIYKHIYG